MAADAIALAGRRRLTTVPATAEVIDRFRVALAARDIIAPESIIADGSIGAMRLTCSTWTAFRPGVL